MRSRFIDDDRTAGNQCADVAFNPPTGAQTPVTVGLSSSTTGAHIFYTKSSPGGEEPPNPTHTGDNATGTTIRIGSNSGSVITGFGTVNIKALAYKSGNTDSNTTESSYFPPEPPP